MRIAYTRAVSPALANCELTHLAPAPGTNRTFPTAIEGKFKETDGVVFDHILGRNVELITTDLFGAEPVKGLWASDHIGVWAKVQVG